MIALNWRTDVKNEQEDHIDLVSQEALDHEGRRNHERHRLHELLRQKL